MVEAGDREVQAQQGDSPADPRAENALNLLLRMFLALRGGMIEFRRAYALGDADSPLDSMDPPQILGRLAVVTGRHEILEALERGIEELMIHQTGLLEAYQAATQHGSRRILDRLDPKSMRDEVHGGSVRVGPLSIPSSFPPVLMQAVWEEYLRRFAELRQLDGTDFERYYRDGFREGYQEFRAARTSRRP